MKNLFKKLFFEIVSEKLYKDIHGRFPNVIKPNYPVATDAIRRMNPFLNSVVEAPINDPFYSGGNPIFDSVKEQMVTK